jgi:hypothetical protein
VVSNKTNEFCGQPKVTQVTPILFPKSFMLYQNFLPRLVIFLPCLGNKITRVGNKITRRGNKCAIDIQVLIGMKIYFLGMKKHSLDTTFIPLWGI